MIFEFLVNFYSGDKLQSSVMTVILDAAGASARANCEKLCRKKSCINYEFCV